MCKGEGKAGSRSSEFRVSGNPRRAKAQKLVWRSLAASDEVHGTILTQSGVSVYERSALFIEHFDAGKAVHIPSKYLSGVVLFRGYFSSFWETCQTFQHPNSSTSGRWSKSLTWCHSTIAWFISRCMRSRSNTWLNGTWSASPSCRTCEGVNAGRIGMRSAIAPR